MSVLSFRYNFDVQLIGYCHSTHLSVYKIEFNFFAENAWIYYLGTNRKMEKQ